MSEGCQMHQELPQQVILSIGMSAMPVRSQASLMSTYRSSSLLRPRVGAPFGEVGVPSTINFETLNRSSLSNLVSATNLPKSLCLSGSRSGLLGYYQNFGRGKTATVKRLSPISIQKRGAIMADLGISPSNDLGEINTSHVVHDGARTTGKGFELDQVPLLRKLLVGMVKPYLNKNPTAVAALELIRKQDPGPICYDHFAFRTFGVDGFGINAIAQIFLDMGYSTRDELHFPGKKLRALWFSPPEHLYDVVGELENGPLPRIFISEILVDQLSKESQQIIHKYIKAAGLLTRHAPTASVLDTLTWPTPSFTDYQKLASESEYAAWTLVHGFALNHATVSVHRLHQMHSIAQLNQFLQDQSIKLNSEGGILKVSPDGGLQQSSSVADSVQYVFAGSEVRNVPASYIEFAERLVLPVYSNLKNEEIYERHRRDGFEVGNADKIFESTSSDQTGLQRV